MTDAAWRIQIDDLLPVNNIDSMTRQAIAEMMLALIQTAQEQANRESRLDEFNQSLVRLSLADSPNSDTFWTNIRTSNKQRQTELLEDFTPKEAKDE